MEIRKKRSDKTPPYVLPSKRAAPERVRPLRFKPGYDRPKFDTVTIRKLLREPIKKAILRSRQRGTDHEITLDDVVEMFVQQDGRCALTGLEMRLKYNKVGTRDPLRPSLDRIDLSKGYVKGNCRLTALIANVARCDFGDDEFYAMCEAAVSLRKSVSTGG